MKKTTFLFAALFLLIFYSCKEKNEVKPNQLRDLEEAEYIEEQEEGANARFAAGTTTLYYQRVTNDQEFGQAINFRYWSSLLEPNADSIKNTPETGTVEKDDLKLTGSVRLPHDKWYVFEEPNDGFLFKFYHKKGVKGLLHIQSENTLYPFPQGFYEKNGNIKVSSLWGTDKTKQEWDLYWFRADDGIDFNDRHQGDATPYADGKIHLYNRDGSGEKKDMYFRLPKGKYQFFVESGDKRYSVKTATVGGSKTPYLKFGFYE